MNYILAFDDEIRWLIGRQGYCAYWMDLLLQNFGILGCSNYIFLYVLVSQKYPWRSVVARKFEIFRVFDILYGVCENYIQIAFVVTDRLGLFSKYNKNNSFYALTMYRRRIQLQNQNCFWEFQRYSDSYMNKWSMNVEFVVNPAFEKH